MERFRIDTDPGSMLKPVRRDGDGALLVEARVARPGIYKYKEDGEVVRVLVPRKSLYNEDSLKTLGRSAYTDGHPNEPITPNNVKQHQDGDVGSEVTVDDDGFVRVKMAVRSKKAIRNVQDGKKEETSPGYHADEINANGEHPEFGPFDRVQGPRNYNHVAGVKRARGGSSVRMRTDSADDESEETEIITGFREDRHMPSTRKAMRLAKSLSDMDRQSISEKIASNIDASRSDVLNMIRGRLSPTEKFLKAFADVVGFDQGLLMQARSKDKKRQENREDGVDETAHFSFDSFDQTLPEKDQDMPQELSEVLDDLKNNIDTLKSFQEDEAEDEQIDVPEDVEQAIEGVSSSVGELVPEVEQMREDRQKLQNQVDKLEGKIEGLTNDSAPAEDEKDSAELRFDSREEFEAYQEERRRLEDTAEQWRVDVDSATNAEMRREIVESVTGKDLEDASQDKIEGMFEGLEERNDHDSHNYDKASEQTGKAFEKGGQSEEGQAKQDFEERWGN